MMHSKYSQKGHLEYGARFVTNPQYIEGLYGTHCIQRLGPPLSEKDGVQPIQCDAWLGLAPFAGMPVQARRAFSALSTLEYMGSAEFEFGAIPQTLEYIVEQMQKGELIAYEHVCSGSIERHYSVELSEIPWIKDLPEVKRNAILDAFSYDNKDVVSPILIEVSVYAISPRHFRPHVDAIIDALAAQENVRLKEPAHFREVLFSPPEFQRHVPTTVGWMEIDNGFLFFADKSIWEKWLQALGLPVPENTRDLRVGDARSELKKLGML